MRPSQAKLGSDRLQFYPGVSYRNLLVVRGGGQPVAVLARHPHHPAPRPDSINPVADGYPRGPGGDLLTRLMSESAALLAEHPVNVARRRSGKPPATHIWLWGLGSRAAAGARLPNCTANRGP